jgi:F-type H+-transporting ATPase subunit delta
MPVGILRGVSRESLAAGRERLETLLASLGPAATPAAGTPEPGAPAAPRRGATAWTGEQPAGPGAGRSGAGPELGDELFSVTDLLASSAGVRRALTDPARGGDAKADLLRRLVGGKVSDPTLDLLSGLVRSRWAQASDLVDAIEALAVEAVLAQADRAGRLDTVEDELFRFSRIVAADQGLRDAFSARTAGVDRKSELVSRLLGGRAAPESLRLAVQAAGRPRGLRTEQVLEGQVEAAARRRRQVVAHVVAALPLDEGQRGRLSAALQRQYGRPVRLNIDVDPDVVGGLRVQVGGELVDGTVSARLDEARRRLTG